MACVDIPSSRDVEALPDGERGVHMWAVVSRVGDMQEKGTCWRRLEFMDEYGTVSHTLWRDDARAELKFDVGSPVLLLSHQVSRYEGKLQLKYGCIYTHDDMNTHERGRALKQYWEEHGVGQVGAGSHTAANAELYPTLQHLLKVDIPPEGSVVCESARVYIECPRTAP